MSDPDPSVVVPMGAGDRPAERLPAHDDFLEAEDSQAADFSGGLVSLAFITAALRRSVRFWCAIAAIGFLLGLGLYVNGPRALWSVAGNSVR